MKKQKVRACLFLVVWGILLGILLAPVSVGAEQETSKTLMEKVEVTNAEVPVRVTLKGQPVLDLKVEDFTLFENNKPVPINGFFLNRKTLAPVSGGAAGAVPRTFVLAFNITDYNQTLERGVGYLFDKILVPGDRILVFINESAREYTDLKDLGQVKNQVLASLQMDGKSAGQRLQEYFLRTETYVGLKSLSKDPGEIIEFLKRYLNGWREYQNQYLLPKTDLFYYFAQYLEKFKGPKWVLYFNQYQFFPRFRPSKDLLNGIRQTSTNLTNSEIDQDVSQGRMLGNLLGQINSELELGKEFPTEAIGKLFYKMDASFCNFYMRSTDSSVLQSAEYAKVATNLETIYNEIAAFAGGKALTSNDWVKDLGTVASGEDTYYLLTYVPANPQKKGTIKVVLKDKKYKAMYDNNVASGYNPPPLVIGDATKPSVPAGIKVVGFSLTDGLLVFTITNYTIGTVDGTQAGRMQVRIRVMDKDNKSEFDSSKVLTTPKTEMKVTIPAFKSLAKGQHTFLIDVVDVLNKTQDNFVQSVEVN